MSMCSIAFSSGLSMTVGLSRGRATPAALLSPLLPTLSKLVHPKPFFQTMSTASPTPPQDPIVQYILVRRDLLSTWTTGSIIAQAVHASVAAIWSSRSQPHTLLYCNQPGNNNNNNNSQPTPSSPQTQMHTVVLEAQNEQALLTLADRLSKHDIHFALWREQPENCCTALAASPYPRSIIKPHFSKFKLFK